MAHRVRRDGDERTRIRCRYTLPAAPNLTDMLTHLDASFADTPLALIDERGLTDADVYKRANLSRQYFSKLHSGAINPGKRVVLALAVALELDLDQTGMLLSRAGHALSHAYMLDAIMEFSICEQRCGILAINQPPYAYDRQLLGT